MSAQGRDVVRYIKSVERGPCWRILHSPEGFETIGPPRNPDWIRAHNRDLFDPFENAKAAIRAYTDPTWSTFRAEFARYLRHN